MVMRREILQLRSERCGSRRHRVIRGGAEAVIGEDRHLACRGRCGDCACPSLSRRERGLAINQRRGGKDGERQYERKCRPAMDNTIAAGYG